MDTTYFYTTLPDVLENMQQEIAGLKKQVEVLDDLLNRVVELLREKGHPILPQDFIG